MSQQHSFRLVHPHPHRRGITVNEDVAITTPADIWRCLGSLRRKFREFERQSHHRWNDYGISPILPLWTVVTGNLTIRGLSVSTLTELKDIFPALTEVRGNLLIENNATEVTNDNRFYRFARGGWQCTNPWGCYPVYAFRRIS